MNINKCYCKLFFLCCILPLILGLAYYIIFGPESIKVFKLCNGLIGRDLTSTLRSDYKKPSILSNHLSDCLWAFSLTSTLSLLLHKEISLHLLLLISNMLIIFIEISQYFGFTKGTFDPLDIVMMLCTSFLAYFIIRRKLPLREKQSFSSGH